MSGTYEQTRLSFKNFFKDNGHEIVASSPVIPANDPSLLFANSGMVQFKNVFTGLEKLTKKDKITEVTTATTAQKCIRAGGKHNDLENVGFTNRHHTFFEMLGNFSFGDYFKEGAIKYAFDFLTKELSLPLEKLYFTVYHNDDEAFNLWKKIAGVSDEKIIRINTNANFWQMGDTGPCGPCSEIFYDYGDKIFGGLPGTKDEDGPRYTEIWNLVFMQFERFEDGTLTPLAKQCIDTGMGLERLVSVLEGKTDNYETSLFTNIINDSKAYLPEAKIKIDGAKPDYVHRIIADHIRAAVFMIADGIMPSNEGRGYVLRRIIRRALRHYFVNGGRQAFMHKLCQSVISQMSGEYQELNRAASFISTTLKGEEDMFLGLLPEGLKILEKESAGKSVLSGDVAFKLYDTFGFPLDITEDILKQKNIALDTDGFNLAMQQQKARSKASWQGSGDAKNNEELIAFASGVKQAHGQTIFCGYRNSKNDTLARQGNIVDAIATEPQTLAITLSQTSFYPEGGGQVCDTGFIEIPSLGSSLEVFDVKKINDVIIHFCKSPEGLSSDILKSKLADLKPNINARTACEANHTATHLLHHALRQRFGDGVVQKGSLVEPVRLRFDFAFNQALTAKDIEAIETDVNTLIASNHPVQKQIQNKEDALKQGVMALFGEKYEEEVRVVTAGQSKELCGGCHVFDTGEIGMFKIIYERGIGGGIRRIEAKTGTEALKFVNAELNNYNQVMEANKVQNKPDSNELLNFVAELKKQNKSLEADLLKLKQTILSAKSFEQKFGFSVLKVSQSDLSWQDVSKLAMLGFNNLKNPIIIEFCSAGGEVINIACKCPKNCALDGISDAKILVANYAAKLNLQNLDQSKAKGSQIFAFI